MALENGASASEKNSLVSAQNLAGDKSKSAVKLECFILTHFPSHTVGFLVRLHYNFNAHLYCLRHQFWILQMMLLVIIIWTPGQRKSHTNLLMSLSRTFPTLLCALQREICSGEKGVLTALIDFGLSVCFVLSEVQFSASTDRTHADIELEAGRLRKVIAWNSGELSMWSVLY